MKREIEFASHPGNLCLVRDFVRTFLHELAFSEPEKELIILGLDEACTNVIRYAYLYAPDQLICLACEVQSKAIVFRVRDFGAQCDPSTFEGRPLDQIQPGGLGIHLIRKAFDEVDYRLQSAGTELILRKAYNGHQSN